MATLRWYTMYYNIQCSITLNVKTTINTREPKSQSISKFEMLRGGWVDKKSLFLCVYNACIDPCKYIFLYALSQGWLDSFPLFAHFRDPSPPIPSPVVLACTSVLRLRRSGFLATTPLQLILTLAFAPPSWCAAPSKVTTSLSAGPSSPEVGKRISPQETGSVAWQ